MTDQAAFVALLVGGPCDGERVRADRLDPQRIGALHLQIPGGPDPVDTPNREPYLGDGYERVWRALASVYADHPDYRREWRP